VDAIVRSYFVAERDLGLFLAVAGVASLAFAAVLYRSQTGAFLGGFLVALGVVGCGSVLGGAALAARSHRQATELAALATTDPKALAAAELPRMARVNANWPRAKALWAVVIVLCLGVLFVVPRDGARSLALVLLVTASALMVIDSLGERRAQVYTEHVRSLER
jgi:hypothetical protein